MPSERELHLKAANAVMNPRARGKGRHLSHTAVIFQDNVCLLILKLAQTQENDVTLME